MTLHATYTSAPGRPKRVAILQSNYIPWKGYFDIIARVDEFILYDEVQFTKNDWRNRNKIKTPTGTQWLTIPVRHAFGQAIRDTQISFPGWGLKHWKSIAQNYRQAPYFAEFGPRFEELYRTSDEVYLSQINRRFLAAICAALGIDSQISSSADYTLAGERTERLVRLCQQAGADAYLSGPAAQCYLDETQFDAAGIALEYMDYGHYPEYRQLFPPFVHEVSVLDLIFNEGPHARRFLGTP